MDDVSQTYVGIDKFPGLPPDGTLPFQLPGFCRIVRMKPEVIGIEGRQRGYPKQKDQYVIAEVLFR